MEQQRALEAQRRESGQKIVEDADAEMPQAPAEPVDLSDVDVQMSSGLEEEETKDESESIAK